MTRRRRMLPPRKPLPDLPTVFIHGLELPPAWVHQNSHEIMDGFDDLPKVLRDRINYASSPEGGARAVYQIIDDLLAK